MKRIQFIAVEVVHLPVPNPSEESLYAKRMLALRNACLQRRLAGYGDAWLIGFENCTEDEFRSKHKPLGLSVNGDEHSLELWFHGPRFPPCWQTGA